VWEGVDGRREEEVERGSKEAQKRVRCLTPSQQWQCTSAAPPVCDQL
jgi:hypothetical protein